MAKGKYIRSKATLQRLSESHKKAHQLKSYGFQNGQMGYWSGMDRPKEEDSCNWKGENVGYEGLHRWVERHLGKPDTCEHCLTSGLQGAKIHWASKSRGYRRDLTDWLRLCASCHGKYDSGNRTGLKIKKKTCA